MTTEICKILKCLKQEHVTFFPILPEDIHNLPSEYVKYDHNPNKKKNEKNNKKDKNRLCIGCKQYYGSLSRYILNPVLNTVSNEPVLLCSHCGTVNPKTAWYWMIKSKKTCVNLSTTQIQYIRDNIMQNPDNWENIIINTFQNYVFITNDVVKQIEKIIQVSMGSFSFTIRGNGYLMADLYSLIDEIPITIAWDYTTKHFIKPAWNYLNSLNNNNYHLYQLYGVILLWKYVRDPQKMRKIMKTYTNATSEFKIWKEKVRY